MTEKTELTAAGFPEQAGVSSAGIEALIKDFEKSGIELHSMMTFRHGKLAHEAHRAPFGRDVPHIMYSVSKSFTSVAIGFAVEEGLVSLDTKVMELFPEYRPQKPDPQLEQVTVFHLLSMSAGINVNVLSDKTHNDWIADFFKSPKYASPGKSWRYISENIYICAVIIKKLTGLTLREYLEPRLFEPLGFGRVPDWETDTHGIEAGGWGLSLTPEELLKFAVCLCSGGIYEGKQIIPAAYVEKALSNLVDNSVASKEEDCSKGYGLCFWMSRIDNVPRCDGMFSQFAVMFRDYDAVFVCTCDEISEQKTRDCIFRNFPGIFIPESGEDLSGNRQLSLSPMPVLPAGKRSPLENTLKGRSLRFAKNPFLNSIGFPTSMLPFANVFMSAEKSGNIDNVTLDFSEEECVMSWDEGKYHNTIHCGMDGKARLSPIRLSNMNFTAYSTAKWDTDNILQIRMRPIEGINERIIRLKFKNNLVVLLPGTSPSSAYLGQGLAYGFKENLPDPIFKAFSTAASGVKIILDEPCYGKII